MLDTRTAAAVMRRTDKDLMRRLEAAAPEEVCLSAITLSELRFGAAMSSRPEQELEALDVLLRHLAVLAYPDEAAEDYAEVRVASELRQEGNGVHALLIAAHARRLGLTLVSRDARKLAGLPRIAVEDWHG